MRARWKLKGGEISTERGSKTRTFTIDVSSGKQNMNIYLYKNLNE